MPGCAERRALAPAHQLVSAPLATRAALERTKDGQPVFGPKSPLRRRTRARRSGAVPARLFGWMVHVMAFSSDDPWKAGHH